MTFPRRRWIRPAAIVLVLAGLGLGLGGHQLYVSPDLDPFPPGERVDAVLALGGLTETAEFARTLVASGGAPVLVLSNPYEPGTAPTLDAACADPAITYRVICFVPDPSTTRGEAQQLRDLAQAHGWTRVAVVAPTFHISRARLLVRRCFPGTLLMVALPVRTPARQVIVEPPWPRSGHRVGDGGNATGTRTFGPCPGPGRGATLRSRDSEDEEVR